MGYLRRDILLYGEPILSNNLLGLIESCNNIFRIDNVAEYYWKNTNDKWKITDYPNLAPLFNLFWMEYKMPNTIYIDGHFQKRTNKLKVSCLFMINEADNDLFKWVASCVMMTERETDNEIIFRAEPEVLRLRINKDGSIFQGLAFTVGDERWADYAPEVFLNYLPPFLLAISFLHCKNVQRVERSLDIPRKERHSKDYFEKYHILKIDPMKKILASEGKSESTGLKNALHICRGHFKDYRDSGLFGKHPGIYWWDYQIRGSKQVGIVNKDYEVKGQ